MSQTNITWIESAVVEDEVHMTIVELSHAASTPEQLIMDWVSEGVLSPAGSSPEDWRFSGDSLKRAKTAARLTRDFEINTSGLALALDLIDQISRLRAEVLRLNGPA
ncbi:MerR family transcriptional regulator [Polynucleobacter paneuropaeus]|nr:MerR family transcriptional regulator [Polynucleobacter paneuropaeus]MBT8554644.1 MerR family transcriptional regulator [Polynucleobacter paneuropaeus]MBT8559921.1 MerR family transcriptional regulator [Polynucleobacter paneuropaeus]